MQAIEELTREHRVIELVLTGLDRLAEQAEREPRLDREQAERALEILRNFADRCHHGKEEHHLFRLLAARGVPKEGGPLGVMLHEHETGRAHLRALAGALEAASAGDTEAIRSFSVHARAYAGLLRQHIQKEDGVLYPLAERVLDPADAADLREAFARIEQEEMGEGVHERYHQWAHQLAKHAD